MKFPISNTRRVAFIDAVTSNTYSLTFASFTNACNLCYSILISTTWINFSAIDKIFAWEQNKCDTLIMVTYFPLSLTTRLGLLNTVGLLQKSWNDI